MRRRRHAAGHRVSVRWTPHPEIVAIRDNKDYISVLLYSYYTTITGWGVLLTYLPVTQLRIEPDPEYFSRFSTEEETKMELKAPEVCFGR